MKGFDQMSAIGRIQPVLDRGSELGSPSTLAPGSGLKRR